MFFLSHNRLLICGCCACFCCLPAALQTQEDIQPGPLAGALAVAVAAEGRCDNYPAPPNPVDPAGGCIGGRAFEMGDGVYCSPACGNEHLQLAHGDPDYWPSASEEEEEVEEEGDAE